MYEYYYMFLFILFQRFPCSSKKTGQLQVNLTPEDQAAVERLEQLGFPRVAVVQAYMAADKNEELAANLLFDMGDDL